MTSRRVLIFIAIAAGITGCDQVTKLEAVARLTTALEGASGIEGLGRFVTVRHPEPRAAVVFLDDVWDFIYTENPGASFSFLRDANPILRLVFLLATSIAGMSIIVVYFRKLDADRRLAAIGLALTFGGALGNFLDRIHLGYVIDFIHWHWGDLSWPVFNIADAAIVVGVGLLLIESYRHGRRTAAVRV